jgi:hypothetical protein
MPIDTTIRPFFDSINVIWDNNFDLYLNFHLSSNCLFSGEFVRGSGRGRGSRGRRPRVPSDTSSFSSDYYYYYMNEGGNRYLNC